MLGKSVMSLFFEDNGFTKKSSYSAPQCGVLYYPGPGASSSVSTMCCVFSAVLSCLLYPSGQQSAKTHFASSGQCAVSGLNIATFN